MQSYRVELLKQMGSNAYRTSHNTPTAELLDACDRLGMLVMDETREFSSSPQGLSELERMVRRDRNHPSVVIWSIANEEPQQGSERGARIGQSMKQLVHKLLKADRTRINADGEDVSVVTVTIADSQGRPVPLANNLIRFTLTGPGKILAVGNGDPSSYEPDHATQRSAFNGLCMCIIQSSKNVGALTLKATSPGLESGEVPIESAVATPRPALA